MINSLLERKIEKRPDQVRLQGRILFLTEDPELIKRQLAGEDLPWDTKNPANNPKLRDDISTDEITPAHYCFYFDETLGEIPYLGSEVRQRDADWARRCEARRICVRGEREAAREGIEPRAISLCGDVRGHSGGDRGEY